MFSKLRWVRGCLFEPLTQPIPLNHRHVQLLKTRAPMLLPKMLAFLGCAGAVLVYLKSNYEHIP